MALFDYYFKVDKKYHDEVYGLISILEISIVDEAMAQKQETAQKRLDELVELSK